jgi:hypothetical protein
VTCIGTVVSGKRLSLVSESGARSKLKPGGWEHFDSRSDR